MSPRTSRLVLAVVGLCAVASVSARAEPLRPELRALVEAELAPHLTPVEVRRLLADAQVQRSLATLLDDWDGIGDTLSVRREGADLVLHTLIRERRCLAAIRLDPESPRTTEPRCDETVRADGDRRLLIDETLWEPPRRRAPPRVADVAPAPAHEQPSEPAPEPRGPVDNTVLRRQPHPGAELEDTPVLQARVAHEALRERLRRPHWQDPLLPADPIEAGPAIRPFEAPAPPVEARVETNLRNPFDAARMRTELPVPDMLTLPPPDLGMPLLPAPREACRDEWRLETATPAPPTLDCYRRVAWHDRLEEDDAYQALSRIASIIDLPLLDTLVAMQVQQAVSHRAHRLVWAFMWLAWVERHPERTSEALAALTPEERRFLRRRLADWWVEPRLDAQRPTVTRLFERHLLGLYPEAADRDGLPRRAFVSDTWLWANNWLSALDMREPAAIASAFSRLSDPERAVIRAFARDRELARRWARAAEVIAAY